MTCRPPDRPGRPATATTRSASSPPPQNGAGQTVSYNYDADGDTTGITYPLPATATWATSGDTVAYGYDKADTLTSVTDFAGNTISITPDADSLPVTETLGSTGDTITTSYDNTDSPSAIALTNAAGSTLQSFSYADAPDGSTLSETDVPSATSASYAYDGKGRIASMTIGSSPALDYGFDASGNLTTLPTGAAGTYDHNSELTSATLSGTTSYTYNADGDRLTSAQGSTTLTSGTWNGAGELTAYTSPAGTMSAAGYDGNGLRQSATFTPASGSASTQNYVWNIAGTTPELLMDSATAYIYAGSGTPAEQVSLATGTISYLNTDSLGSVRGIVTSAGALAATTSYDAWGNPQTSGGLTSYTPFGYAGAYTDPDGLLYLINRYYDPQTGQFTSLDPAVAKTLAPYGYASGNPVNTTDPDGLCARGAPGSPPIDCAANNGGGDVGGHGTQAEDPCVAAGDCEQQIEQIIAYETPPRPKPRPRPTDRHQHATEFSCQTTGRIAALSGCPSMAKEMAHYARHVTAKQFLITLTVGTALLAGGEAGLGMLGAGGDAITTGDVSVYTSTNAAGDVDYVGITNNIERRAAEQLASKGIDINPINGLENLSRADARAVEQVLIEDNGGPGGQLLNKINSIATSNPAYGSSIQRGCELLAAVGYCR